MAIGNTGYVAPERIQNGFESAKGTTYAFGLLLLKLSRPLHGLRPQEEQSLVKWASSRLHYNESLEKMVDPNIQKPLWSRALSRSAVIVSLCVRRHLLDILDKIAADDILVVLHLANICPRIVMG